ncbi:paraquat-inducible protein A [Thiolapillus sp.]
MDEEVLMACRECDALQRVPWVPAGKKARCRECGTTLYHHPRGGLDRPIALLLGALVLYVLANSFPLVTLDIGGATRETSLIGTAWALYNHDMRLLGILVFLTSLAVPGAILFGTLYVLTGLRLQRNLPGLRQMLALLSHIHPWEMADVFVISILVALVKMSGMAEVILDAGLYALIGYILLAIAASASIDIFVLWRRMERIGHFSRGRLCFGVGK